MKCDATFLVGFLTGLRSLTPLATIARAAHQDSIELHGPLALLGTGVSARALAGLAALELVGDKLPITPSRTQPLGLLGRIGVGKLAGACVASNTGESLLTGAILGAAGALLGSFAGSRGRALLARAIGGHDFPIALVEDLIAVGGSVWLVSSLRKLNLQTND